MPSKINLWSYLSEEHKTELIELACSVDSNVVYVFHRPYYRLRNSAILLKYNQLKKKYRKKQHKDIIKQVAIEVSDFFQEYISPKMVEHVIYKTSPK